MKITEKERNELIKELKEMIGKSDANTLYTVLRHVSSSGMSRAISVFFIDNEQTPRNIDWYVERILHYKRSKHEGLTVSGCGMDMGFHVVYSLCMALFKEEGLDKAGYTLHHRWL